jgi:Protein of unknown function (DUF2442)
MTSPKSSDWVETELRKVDVDVQSKRSNLQEAQKPLNAVAARFDDVKKRIVIDLDNGAEFSFPPILAQGLSHASEADLKQIEISPLGTGLHWPKLDVDLTVDGLLAGVFGGHFWMRDLAVKAKVKKSQRKSNAI